MKSYPVILINLSNFHENPSPSLINNSLRSRTVHSNSTHRTTNQSGQSNPNHTKLSFKTTKLTQINKTSPQICSKPNKNKRPILLASAIQATKRKIAIYPFNICISTAKSSRQLGFSSRLSQTPIVIQSKTKKRVKKKKDQLTAANRDPLIAISLNSIQ